ncbi:hypothetical protein ARMGADRAFT_1037233 [Armillaria gallica]|uniref:MULE transposase domain-containing protein n=1 Tax=Armillaria gallica TaxID=47427 RepID=A0A2H3CMQ8_ARMGA|nr:hypothetical protein ARMGADRAFT_1037233 [Armillaria gallica]
MLHTLSLADPLGDFIVPGLENVPTPNKDRTELTVPSILWLSLQSRTELDTHVKAVRLDVRKYNYSRSSQAAAMLLLANLDLYIPTENEHNVQCKYSIIRTDSKFRSSKVPKSKQGTKSQDEKKHWKQTEHIYQCQCGVDHMQGRFAAAEGKRQIPWENVGCPSYQVAVLPYILANQLIFLLDGILVAVNEISGILDHLLPHTLYNDGNKARFELVISTPQQQEATWKYGHQKQVFMDLTFGFSSSHVLLAILLAVDENKCGVPLGFLLFSARKDAKAVHADYNGELLTHLLERFKSGLGTNSHGETFDIRVGNTDNDVCERKALTENWPSIFLLLCIFHVWQAWRNGLNKNLRSIPKGEAWKTVRLQIALALMKLLKEVDEYDEAKKIYQDKRHYFAKLSKKHDRISKLQGKAGTAFLDYFDSYNSLQSYWKSWSPAGAKEAAILLDIPVNQVTRTTNLLESFNGRIKGKYFAPYMHGGRLPRVDMWILLIITQVMPDFFCELADKKANHDYITSLRTLAPKPAQQSYTPDYETSLMAEWLAEEEVLDDNAETDSEAEDLDGNLDKGDEDALTEDTNISLDSFFGTRNSEPAVLLLSSPYQESVRSVRRFHSFEIIPETPEPSITFSSAPSSPTHLTPYAIPPTMTSWLHDDSRSMNATLGSDLFDWNIADDSVLSNGIDSSSDISNAPSNTPGHDARLTTALMTLQQTNDTLFRAL